MTNAGIEYNLEKTPYVLQILYPYTSAGMRAIDYHFSSERALEKFSSEYLNNREAIRASLSNRFKISVDISDDFCDIQLYKRLERRGFHVVVDGEVAKWLGKLVYDGTKISVMSSDVK